MLAAALLLAGCALAAPQGRPVAAVDLAPGLYLDGRKILPAQWPAHREAQERLVARFLAEVRPPFELEPGETIVSGLDDLAYHPIRDGRSFIAIPKERGIGFSVSKPHEGIDVGSRVRRADGTIRFLGRARAHPVYPGARVVHGDAHFKQKVVLAEGRYVLALELLHAHVHGGILGGDDDWDSMDRSFAGSRKGNHVHLEVRGLNDLELDHYIERRRSGGGDPALMAYLRYREAFLNERLLPALRTSRLGTSGR